LEAIRPKLWDTMRNYSGKQFSKDAVSGIIVAIIALPLSIALALASGVAPEKGIYTAIVAGFLISFLGGSRVQIAGPTAAFATIVAGIAARDGMEGLITATIMAGAILILMGIFRLGALIKFIPYTITTGFTAGIAVTIFIGQIKDFFGLSIQEDHALIETVEKLVYAVRAAGTASAGATLVGAVSLFILIAWPKVNKVIPGSLIAVIVGIVMVSGLGIKANTIGNLYTIKGTLLTFQFPKLSLASMGEELGNAFTIAFLAAIESLLSCVVADGMINDRHNSNTELVAQGVGNIASVLFGGIPATGAIARTAANIKNGGRTPVAGMVHSAALLLALIALMPAAALIPMPTIAAILFMVAYNMSGWRQFVYLLRTAPKSDILVLAATFVLTIAADLVTAIGGGMILAAALFIRRVSSEMGIQQWKSFDDEDDPESMSVRKVPPRTLVYEINGPMFFGAADKIMDVTFSEKEECLILRARGVISIDTTALRALEQVRKECEYKGVRLILSHVNEQPFQVMEKEGFADRLGRENFCRNIDEALALATQMTAGTDIGLCME